MITMTVGTVGEMLEKIWSYEVRQLCQHKGFECGFPVVTVKYVPRHVQYEVCCRHHDGTVFDGKVFGCVLPLEELAEVQSNYDYRAQLTNRAFAEFHGEASER